MIHIGSLLLPLKLIIIGYCLLVSDEGRTWLSKTFKTCTKLQSEKDVRKLKDWLYEVYVNFAMTNYPYSTNFLEPLPAHPVKVISALININLIKIVGKSMLVRHIV